MSPWDRAWRSSRNDWRLHLLSIFSVAVAFVCLAAAVLVVVNVDGVRTRWTQTGRVSIYLRPSTAPTQVDSLKAALVGTPGVKGVRFVSSSEARRDILGNRGDEMLSLLSEQAFPASLEVSLEGSTAPERARQISAQASTLPMVDSVETYHAWSDRLSTLMTGGVTAALILAFVVLAAVISVVSSTIRLSLQRRRVEVEVLKLVGATDGFVRRPFVIEGAAQGTIGAGLAILLLGVLYAIVRGHFDSELGVLFGINPTFLPWFAQLAMVALGGGLGAVAAWGSLRKLLTV